MVASGAARLQAPFVRAAVAGDDAAFRRLYDEYGRSVYNMILRSVRDAQLAEDLAQEVWLKAHRQLAKLRDPEAFQAWLYRIATKACIDAARSRARRIDGAPLDDGAPAQTNDPETDTIARDEAKRVWEALAALPARQHLALFLREVEHLPYQEIARILGVSETAAGLCLYRGRRSFAAAYERAQDLDADGRCQSMRRMMSLNIDRHSTAVQDSVLNTHLKECHPCRCAMETMRTSSERYAGIALASAPFVWSDALLASAFPAKAGLGSLLAKLLAPVAAPAKASIVTASVIAGAVVAPHAGSMALDAANGTPSDGLAPWIAHSPERAVSSEKADDVASIRDPRSALPTIGSRDKASGETMNPDAVKDELLNRVDETLKPLEELDDTLEFSVDDVTGLLPEPGLPPLLDPPLAEVQLPLDELPLEVELPLENELPFEAEVLDVGKALPDIEQLPAVDTVPAPEEIVPTVEVVVPLPLQTALPTLPPLLP